MKKLFLATRVIFGGRYQEVILSNRVDLVPMQRRETFDND